MIAITVTFLPAMAVSMVLQAFTPPARTLEKGASSGIETARQVSLSTADQLTALWNEHGSAKPRPTVDFSKDMVVAVFLGTRTTSGYAVEIIGYRSASPGLKDVIVEYRETAPGRDAISAQVLTSPYHIAVIPKQTGTVSFQKVQS